jgi:hypothetical protein
MKRKEIYDSFMFHRFTDLLVNILLSLTIGFLHKVENIATEGVGISSLCLPCGKIVIHIDFFLHFLDQN